MEDLFKKFVYTGVGMVSSSLEKFQKSVEKLVDEDKLSQEEGKKLVDDLFKNTESKREEFETKLKKVVEEVMVRMPPRNEHSSTPPSPSMMPISNCTPVRRDAIRPTP